VSFISEKGSNVTENCCMNKKQLTECGSDYAVVFYSGVNHISAGLQIILFHLHFFQANVITVS